jgi:phosphoribosylformimino-5-aminoimidazole carboxamide ribotide isomerase
MGLASGLEAPGSSPPLTRRLRRHPLPEGEGSFILILGLETLAGRDALRAIGSMVDPARLAFSLDSRDGRPLLAPGADWGTDDPLRLAALALDVGIRRLILLDLTRVGTGRGVGTVALLQTLRRRSPECELVAGGGVAGRDDLKALEDAGASAALVGSALHDGRLDLGGRPG